MAHRLLRHPEKPLKPLKNIASPQSNDFLLTVLESDDNSEICELAIQALASCGTITEVEPITKWGATRPRRQAKLCKIAVAEIQKRIGPADAGWLSLKGTGHLNGAVSISDEPDEAIE